MEASKWGWWVASNGGGRGCSRPLVTIAIKHSVRWEEQWHVMSKPQYLLLLLLYRRSQEVVIEDREEEWVDTERLNKEEKKRETAGGNGEREEKEGKMRRRTLINFAASVFVFPQKEEIKGEVVLNDFYSFASASLLFISLLFSLSPTVGRFSGWFSEVVFFFLSLAFFTGLPWPAAVAPGLLGLERGALYLST